jgi:Icc-related predicted phosphoesterase
MLKIVAGTDFHGDPQKFIDILNFATEQKIFLIHIGADLLPKGSNMLAEQKRFINGFLKNYYQKAKDLGIDIIGSFGNDDIYTRKPYFRKYASLLDEVPYSRDGYEFTAYPWVLDYPFGLKTACKLESEGWTCPDPYLGSPCDFDEQGYFKIPDVKEYFRKKGTIEDDLKLLKATNKTIMAMHMPPAGVELDVCYGGRRVGSKAIYDWINREMPLISLHGHIHENFDVTGNWKAYIGNTLVVQPGQGDNYTHAVYFEIEGQKVDAHFLKL